MTTITVQIDDDSSAAIKSLVANENARSGGSITFDQFLTKQISSFIYRLAYNGLNPVSRPTVPSPVKIAIGTLDEPGKDVVLTAEAASIL